MGDGHANRFDATEVRRNQVHDGWVDEPSEPSRIERSNSVTYVITPQLTACSQVLQKTCAESLTLWASTAETVAMERPTMDDVAQRAGVSRSLVSLVMRGSPRVSDAARSAVERAARDLNYRPNLAARQLASRRTLTVGLILNDLHNLFFPEVTEGIHAVASGSGYRILINNGRQQASAERTALDNLIDLQVDAVLLAGTILDDETLIAAAEQLPVCAIGRSIDHHLVDTVNNDNRMGSNLVVDHLVELGHRHICHITGGDGAGSLERREGFIAAMQRHGLEPMIIEGHFSEQAGAHAAHTLLQLTDPPTAVYAANDLSALGVMGVFKQSGLGVPDRFSVVGYDNTALASFDYVHMTSVEQQRHRIGEIAMNAVLRRLDSPRQPALTEIVAPELIIRSTTGPRRSGPISPD